MWTLLLLLVQGAFGKSYGTWMLDSIISRRQGLSLDADAAGQIELGILQQALRQSISATHDPCTAEKWSEYLTLSVDSIVRVVSNAATDTNFPLDRFSIGTSVIDVYERNGNITDLDAIDSLYKSISLQPKNANDGLWYYTYDNLSYLDGMYSFAPFDLSYGLHVDQSRLVQSISDTLLQLNLLYEHCLDNSSGLLFHGYDASKLRVWSEPITGASHIVWGRALGWYMIALVETLSMLPISRQSKQWKQLHSRFVSLCNALVEAADRDTGIWWQVTTAAGRAGNFPESSSSAMFVYVLLRGVRLGFLPRDSAMCNSNRKPNHDTLQEPDFVGVANRAYGYIVDNFVVFNANHTLSYNNTVAVCSLNSSGTYEYYVSQPILFNSLLGTSAFVLASLEYEAL